MLLAEANQWPEDTRPYFGDGDECHMSFHFPLMPRMYMALAQEDRYPITDILRQTPEIPENCQWALFLRNHDELTLEMVTEDERDYLWRTYASDPRARINLGIRRRLAPLLDNDRRKIELMNGLLLSMPGTPVLYYGDELGMGDNYYLGDRDGVRTPMQWSADRNGGFSRADPQRLYLPPIMDANFGYQAINVEAQQRDHSSLLNWMRRMIAVRQAAAGVRPRQPVFPLSDATARCSPSRASMAISTSPVRLQPAPLGASRRARSVGVPRRDARRAHGQLAVPVGRRAAVHADSAGLRLLLVPAGERGRGSRLGASRPIEPAKELVTAVFAQGWRSVLEGRERDQLERASLPEFVARQRWFGGKDARICERRAGSHWLRSMATVTATRCCCSSATLQDGETQRYFLPLSAAWGVEHVAAGAARLPFTLAKLRRGARVGALLDAAHDERFARALADAVSRGGSLATPKGQLVFEASGTWDPVPARRQRALGRRRAEQQLAHRRRADAGEALPAPARGRAARDRDGAVPQPGRRLQEHARAARAWSSTAPRRASRRCSGRCSSSCATRATAGR